MPQSSKNYPSGFAAVLVLAVVAVLIAGGFGLIKFQGNQIGSPDKGLTITPIITLEKNITPRACTNETKICPDGSYVSRVLPDCNFAPCPLAAIPTVSSKIAPTQTSSSTITNESLDNDLKSLESVGMVIDGGIVNIDQSLNDKSDNLVE